MKSSCVRVASLAFATTAITMTGWASAAAARATPPSAADTASHATAIPDAPGQPSAGIQDIIVTASKTGETAIQRTAIAISAFTSEGLQQSRITNVKDLTSYVPNLSINQATTYAEIYIRGIGSTNVYGGSDPSVTVQVDGVYLGRPYAQFAEFLDVSRVEVLRGPQGTLYGRNAAGGTINIVSKTPSNHWQGEELLAVGNYGLFQGQTYLSGPLAPRLQFSVAGSYDRHSPYIRNIVSSGNDIFNANRYGLRGQLRWEAAESIDATTRVDFSRSRENTEAFSKLLAPFDPITDSILGDYTKVALDRPNHDDVRTWGIAEDIHVKLGHDLDLRSITAYRNSRNRVAVDSDATDLAITAVDVAEDQHQFSSELNLTGHYHRLSFVTGLYYFKEHVATNLGISIFPIGLKIGLQPVNTATSYAGFAQGTFKLTDALSITAGARYSRETKTVGQTNADYLLPSGILLPGAAVFQATRHFSAWTPKFSVQWQPQPSILAYVSATRGFKSGGFNLTATSPATAGFAPESLWSYEAGAKTDWLDHRLRLNLTGFIYDYSNLQILLATAPGVADIANAATAKIKGIELEMKAKPATGLDIGANLAYLHAVYTKYPAAPFPQSLGPGSIDATGKRLNNAPPYSASVFAQQSVPISAQANAYVRGEYSWVAHQFDEPTNYYLQEQPAYHLLNLSVGVTGGNGRWNAEFWCKNATNSHYLTGTQDAGATFSGQPGAPRTFGGQVSFKW